MAALRGRSLLRGGAAFFDSSGLVGGGLDFCASRSDSESVDVVLGLRGFAVLARIGG